MNSRKVLLVLVIIISGCTPALKSVVFNNTSNAVIVELCSEKYEIPAGEHIDILSVLCGQVLNIKIGSIIHYYDDKFINYPLEEKYKNYIEKKIGERVIKYQINRNGDILLVPVRENFPYVHNIVQPIGFPIKPKNS